MLDFFWLATFDVVVTDALTVQHAEAAPACGRPGSVCPDRGGAAGVGAPARKLSQ